MKGRKGPGKKGRNPSLFEKEERGTYGEGRGGTKGERNFKVECGQICTLVFPLFPSSHSPPPIDVALSQNLEEMKANGN